MIGLRLAFVLVASLLPLLLTACDESRREPKVTGQDAFLRYCASCHGADAKGNGPMAASLKKPPADLTKIARRAGGAFDEASVMATIDGRRKVAEHGSREMPVWGDVFEDELKDQRYRHYSGLLQSKLLMDYLRSIQSD